MIETVLGYPIFATKPILLGMQSPQQAMAENAINATVQSPWPVMLFKAIDIVKADEAHTKIRLVKKAIPTTSSNHRPPTMDPQSAILTIVGYLR